MSNRELSTARRKILKASAAAAPLVATLKSGAAMAASSGICNPPSEEVSNKKFPDQGNSLYGDTAVRYSVPTYESNTPGNIESRYIYEIDGELYHNSGRVFTGDIADYTQLPADKQAHVLMLYDNDESGTYEVGLWPKFQVQFPYSSSDQFPINASCLTSIAVSGTNTFRGL
jgi:hypothetical protein